MLKKILLLSVGFFPLALLAQKTFEPGTVTFEKSTKSVVSYSGIGVEYYKPSSLYGAKDDQLSSGGIGISYEVFSPFAAKSAVTLNSAWKFMHIGYGSDFSYTQSSIEMNLGLHQILAKGFYVKPQLGVALVDGKYQFGSQTDEFSGVFKGMYGAQTGFLFKLPTERPKLLDVGLMYQGYFGGGSYLGVAAKYLLGPKN